MCVNTSSDAFLDRPDWYIALEVMLGLLPEWAMKLLEKAPIQRLRRLQDYMNAARKVGQELLDRQMALYAQGKEGSKDLMSILSKSLSH
jgi:hypothetical protein